MQSSFKDWWESYDLPPPDPTDLMKIIEDAYLAGLDDGYGVGYEKGREDDFVISQEWN
jgi:hypothetical protein